MKQRIVNLVKYNKTVYWIYSRIGVLAINILKLFTKQDCKSIIFVAYGGKKYDDSPKAIYEAMLKDPRFDEYKLIWALVSPENVEIPRGEKVKIDSYQYYKKLLSSKVWITNSSVNRGLNFYVKGALYINTWHGIPIKKLGRDTSEGNRAFTMYEDYTDYYFTSSPYDRKIMNAAFGIPYEKLLEIGLPRNDELYRRSNKKEQFLLKQKFDIEVNKKVILYAPTFREFTTEGGHIVQLPPMDLKKWEEELGKDYVLLFRAHYEVSKLMDIHENSFVRNMTNYPNVNDLMLVSDILISDYSSMFFDFSILKRPMLCFCYDYDEYALKRGLYFDIREELKNEYSTEEEVIDAIKNMDEKKSIAISFSFFKKYMPEYGEACNKTLNLIYERVTKK